MNVNEYLQTVGAVVVSRELCYAVPVPPSCRGRVTVTVSEPEGLDAYARVSWSPDGKTWGRRSVVADTEVGTLRRQIAEAIAAITPKPSDGQ